jgi:GH25 family lysozyme M1 (1,4-beta-N-acetylmuramidase)
LILRRGFSLFGGSTEAAGLDLLGTLAASACRVLGGCRGVVREHAVTITGPDISSFQGGLNVRALPSAFLLAKCTEGTYYADAWYATWLSQAKTSGKILIAYHFLKSESSATAQAAWLKAHLVDTSLPVMVDVETEGTSKPDLAQVLAFVDACKAIGVRVRLAYLPSWYHQQIGSPDLTPLTARGVGLISSSYPGGSGYPGDSALGWQPYGGVTPLLWQFTDVAYEGGQKVGDLNAYKGSAVELAALLGTTTPTVTPTPSGGSTVGTIPPSIGQKWPEIAAQFVGDYDDSTAIIWADGGARAAALYAQQARDAVNALAARIGQPPTVDVNALADAIAPHLTAGAGADEVATAVVAHLAATLAKG